MSDIKGLDPETNEPLLDHLYDGIQELDNPLPGWWLATFYGAIVFAVGYLFVIYNFYGGEMIAYEYETTYSAHQEVQAQKEKKLALEINNDVLAKKAGDASSLEAGKKEFLSGNRCSSCHGQAGEGGIGPNLADKNWLNGDGTPLAIYNLIKKGVIANGMPAWGNMLGQDELVNISAYVISLKGSNPPNAKAPQGKVYD